MSGWDRQQFDDAVQLLMKGVPMDSTLDKRIAAAYAQAMGTKRDMLNSYITIGIGAATAKAQHFGQDELNRQYAEGYNIKRDNNIHRYDVPQSVSKQSEFGDRLWVHSDVMSSRMKNVLNRALASGLDKAKLALLTKYVAQGGTRMNNNLATQANQMLSRIHTLMRDSGIINTNSGYKQANAEHPSDVYIYAQWHTQEDDAVCDVCAPLDGRIWLWDEAPEPILDTHDGCRCWRARVDKDGNVDPSDDYSNPYA